MKTNSDEWTFGPTAPKRPHALPPLWGTCPKRKGRAHRSVLPKHGERPGLCLRGAQCCVWSVVTNTCGQAPTVAIGKVEATVLERAQPRPRPGPLPSMQERPLATWGAEPCFPSCPRVKLLCDIWEQKRQCLGVGESGEPGVHRSGDLVWKPQKQRGRVGAQVLAQWLGVRCGRLSGSCALLACP